MAAPELENTLEASELTYLTTAEGMALGLARAADEVSDALCGGGELAPALARNVDLWAAIEAIVLAANDGVPEPIASNLLNLADFVHKVTVRMPEKLNVDTVRALININLELSQGLVDAKVDHMVLARAHDLWVQAGRPEGRRQLEDFFLTGPDGRQIH